jgi:hypothetical protein
MSSAQDGPPSLPEGVTAEMWNEEKTRFQNPRIRAFLACNQRLERVRDSNYAILHCSPARVAEIITVLRELAAMIRAELRPLVAVPSCIPDLEQARASIEGYVAGIEREVLAEIDRLPTQLREDRLGGVRKAICVWIGKLHAFLADGESAILAADPRGQRVPETRAPKRSPRDAEEAAWLHASVLRLQAVIEGMEDRREAALVKHAAHVVRAARVLDRDESEATIGFVAGLRDNLVPRLREVLNLRGIRAAEIELLEGHAAGLLQQCAVALELQSLGEAFAAEAATDERAAAIVAARQAETLRAVSRRVLDLGTFVTIWQQLIAKRRSLLLAAEAEGAAPQAGSV